MLGGDIGLIEAKLDDGRRLLAAVQPDSADTGPALAAHYGISLLSIQTASCYCEAGQPAQAVETYEKFLDRDAFSRRDYGYFGALATLALTAASRPDDAVTAGRQSLATAAATDSVRTGHGSR
jgi:hypothetical protein